MSPPRTPALSRLRRAPLTYQIALGVALAATAALVHVHVRLAVLQAGYDLSKETKRRHDLTDQNQKLRLELATRRDPARVELRARDELGMAPPEAAAIRILKAGPADTEARPTDGMTGAGAGNAAMQQEGRP